MCCVMMYRDVHLYTLLIDIQCFVTCYDILYYTELKTNQRNTPKSKIKQHKNTSKHTKNNKHKTTQKTKQHNTTYDNRSQQNT